MRILFLFLMIMSFTPSFSQYVQKVGEYSIADVKICVVTQPIFADLCVFLTTNASSVSPAENKGIWMLRNGAAANFKIKEVSSSAADLKVCYVSSPIQAGWKNPGKKIIIDRILEKCNNIIR